MRVRNVESSSYGSDLFAVAITAGDLCPGFLAEPHSDALHGRAIGFPNREAKGSRRPAVPHRWGCASHSASDATGKGSCGPGRNSRLSTRGLRNRFRRVVRSAAVPPHELEFVAADRSPMRRGVRSAAGPPVSGRREIGERPAVRFTPPLHLAQEDRTRRAGAALWAPGG